MSATPVVEMARVTYAASWPCGPFVVSVVVVSGRLSGVAVAGHRVEQVVVQVMHPQALFPEGRVLPFPSGHLEMGPAPASDVGHCRQMVGICADEDRGISVAVIGPLGEHSLDLRISASFTVAPKRDDHPIRSDWLVDLFHSRVDHSDSRVSVPLLGCSGLCGVGCWISPPIVGSHHHSDSFHPA